MISPVVAVGTKVWITIVILSTKVIESELEEVAPESAIIAMYQRLKHLENKSKICVCDVLENEPFTSKDIPILNGNVPSNSRFFRQNYLRPLPVIGNGLRKEIDDYEKGRVYMTQSLGKYDGLYNDRAISTIVADLDTLDLLRNAWLDAIQNLQAASADADPTDDEDISALLQTALEKGFDYLKAAQLTLPDEPSLSKTKEEKIMLQHVCDQ